MTPPSPEERDVPLHRRLEELAPKFVELSDDVVFGDIWRRPGLSKRDRSLVTVAALVALHRDRYIRVHMKLAMQNGVTSEELVEAITHLAFYAGFPNATTALTALQELLAEDDS